MERLIDLIQRTLELDDPLEADTPLLTSGLVDSFDVVALLAVFESEYGAVVSPEDVDADTFDTPAQILDMLASVGPSR